MNSLPGHLKKMKFALKLLLPLLLAVALRSSGGDFKVGLVLDRGGKDDKSFNSSAYLGANQAKEKISGMQAHASALDELLESGVLEDVGGGKDDIQKELDQLGTRSQVDDDLAALKAQMAASGALSPGAGPAGTGAAGTGVSA